MTLVVSFTIIIFFYNEGHCLIVSVISDKEKVFITSTLRTVLLTFFEKIRACAFVTTYHFYLSLIFASKAGASSIAAPYRTPFTLPLNIGLG